MLSLRRAEQIANPKGRNWCFTLAHPTQEEMEFIANKINNEDQDTLTRAIVGKELGQNGDFEHLQGYLSFTNNHSLWQMRRTWSERAHWETSKGTPQSNFEYCSKENNILVTKGFEKTLEKMQKEKRANEYWLNVIKDAMTMNPNQFQEQHPIEWMLRRGAIERIMLESAKRKMKAWDGILTRKNVWLWVAPGIGKSKWANNLATSGETFRKNFNKWWCGMETRTVTKVIVEDWPASLQGDVRSQHLKIWGDRYCFCGETKGSSIRIMPGAFFLLITSNYPIKSCFQREEDYNAIKRRFCEIQMTKQNEKLVSRLNLDETILAKIPEEDEDEQENEEEPAISLEEPMEAMNGLVPAEEVGEREQDEEDWKVNKPFKN
jgi:hypothetical protein